MWLLYFTLSTCNLDSRAWLIFAQAFRSNNKTKAGVITTGDFNRNDAIAMNKHKDGEDFKTYSNKLMIC